MNDTNEGPNDLGLRFVENACIHPIQDWDVANLEKLPNNPRWIENEDFERLRESIRDNPAFFAIRPIVAVPVSEFPTRDEDFIARIIAGNMRYEAAVSLGWAYVPVMLIEGLTKDEEDRISIQDNISAGQWDWEKLANSWSDLPLEEWGVPNAPETLKIDNPTRESSGAAIATVNEMIHALQFNLNSKQYANWNKFVKRNQYESDFLAFMHIWQESEENEQRGKDE